MLLWEIIDQNGYGHEYVEATSMPLPLPLLRGRNLALINSEAFRESRRVQEQRSSE